MIQDKNYDSTDEQNRNYKSSQQQGTEEATGEDKVGYTHLWTVWDDKSHQPDKTDKPENVPAPKKDSDPKKVSLASNLFKLQF